MASNLSSLKKRRKAVRMRLKNILGRLICPAVVGGNLEVADDSK